MVAGETAEGGQEEEEEESSGTQENDEGMCNPDTTGAEKECPY